MAEGGGDLKRTEEGNLFYGKNKQPRRRRFCAEKGGKEELSVSAERGRRQRDGGKERKLQLSPIGGNGSSKWPERVIDKGGGARDFRKEKPSLCQCGKEGMARASNNGQKGGGGELVIGWEKKMQRASLYSHKGKIASPSCRKGALTLFAACDSLAPPRRLLTNQKREGKALLSPGGLFPPTVIKEGDACCD